MSVEVEVPGASGRTTPSLTGASNLIFILNLHLRARHAIRVVSYLSVRAVGRNLR